MEVHQAVHRKYKLWPEITSGKYVLSALLVMWQRRSILLLLTAFSSSYVSVSQLSI